VDLPAGSNHLQSAFIEEVEDEDIPVLSSGPQPISHATVQHIDDPDIFEGPGPPSSSVHPSGHSGDLGSPDSDDDSLPFLGDPNLNSLVKQHHLNQPDWCGCLKWLINASEEVYTINIQPTSDYLDIMAL